jgi:hypothetical protein
VIFMVVWIAGWYSGRLRGRGGVLVRLLPTLAVLSTPLFLGAFLFAAAGGSWETLTVLGTPSPAALAIYWLSLSIPILGLLSLGVGMAAQPETPFSVRGLALLSGALALGATAFFWQYGWIGLQTWL